MDIIIKSSLPKLREKLLEALQAVLPIAAIMLVLCFSIAPVSPSILLCFLLGAAMIIVGIMFFTLGAEMSMTPMGERVGSMLTRSQNLFLIIGVGFLLGFLITISEPDLQVLANQVPSIPNMTLILSVATGVGIFLVMAFLRMLLGIPLPRLLVIFYAAIFLLAAFVPKEFLAVAFDSGGVTTGPMTVPFIMALGVGVSAIRSDRHAADDSFGLVALCSVGPILAVLILGIVFNASESSYLPPVIPEVGDSVELWQLFSEGLPTYLHEIATSLLPIVVMFGIFQLAALRIDRRTLGRIGVGLVYTYIGLVLFLTGANIGFMPAGNYLGQVLGGQSSRWLLIPIGMLIGYFIVRAEPAVYVLNKQVEEVTDGAISAGTMGAALSAGVSLSVGLAMVRVLTGISILWFLIPGYLFAIGISFVVPKLYTAIAFDAGGVASGPMTATFLLPLAQGACIAVGGNIVTDAFGVVAMVAMTPLITVQLMGLVAQLKTRKARSAQPLLDAAALLAELPDDAIIELEGGFAVNTLYWLVTITDRPTTDAFLKLYKSFGVDVSLRTVGAGTAVQETLSTLGLEKTEKAVLFAIITADSWPRIQKALRRQMRIDVPGTGIAFIVPVSSIGGKRALLFLTEHQTLELKEESTLKDTRYDLLLVIANQGYTGSIMDAARAAGAGGGTVIHAKGTGMEGAAKFMGIDLVNEKELVLIVSRTSEKNAIMKAIMDNADKKAGSIVFSLPVTDTAGLRLLDEE